MTDRKLLELAPVWRSPITRKRYLTRHAAIKATARRVIYSKYPREDAEFENGFMSYEGYDIATDEPERYGKIFRRLCRIISNRTPRAAELGKQSGEK